MRPVSFTLECVLGLPDSYDYANEEDIIEEVKDDYPNLINAYFFMTFIQNDIKVNPPAKVH